MNDETLETPEEEKLTGDGEEKEMSFLDHLEERGGCILPYLLIFLVLFYPELIMSQIPPLIQGLYSLDTPPDPRIVALGESFAGMRSNVFASVSNPASLANVKGVHAKYSHRNSDWIEDTDMRHQSGLAMISTSIVNLGFFYNRFTWGEFFITSEQNPDGDGSKIKIYDHTDGITLARLFGESFSLGATFKTFTTKSDIKLTSTSPVRVLEFSTPFLFDLGSTYSLLEIGASATQRFTVGMALQNFGVDYTVKDQPVQPAPAPTPTYYVVREEQGIKLPRYLRLGLSYEFSLISTTEGSLSPFGFLLTAEYRNIFNYDRDKDYWGVGMEATVYEVVAIRLGSFWNATGGVYGRRGQPALRYGAGINLPFKQLGVTIPLGLRVDYAGIPLNNSVVSKAKTLSVFSLELSYEQDLF